jgi:mono/diheme cytochrome c family protein
VRRALLASLALGAVVGACGSGRRSFEEPVRLGGEEIAPEVLNRGEMAYMRYCRGCHGAEGAGDGPYGSSMDPRPADLTRGAYPRIGATDELPTDAELARVIREGIEGTPMGPVPMDDADREAIVQYLKTLSPRWRE